jgi:hypothetical protein
MRSKKLITVLLGAFVVLALIVVARQATTRPP